MKPPLWPLLVILGVVALFASPQQSQQSAGVTFQPTYRSIYVTSETVYLKREAMEQAITQNPAFKRWDIRVQSQRENADLAVLINRVPLSFQWTYALQEVRSGKALASGKVTAYDPGKAATLIADHLAGALKPGGAEASGRK